MHIKHWQQLEIITDAKIADQLAELLTAYDALAISFVDAAHEPLFQLQPNETPQWQATKILALFSEDYVFDPLLMLLSERFNHKYDFKINLIEEEDWVRKTQENFPPQHYGDLLWIIPTWYQASDFQGTVLTLEPGLGFGTGTHPTTALCLEWLATHSPQGQTVVDFGCGSGILALSALALGAKAAFAIDHDAQALIATQNNAALNPHLPKTLFILPHEPLPYIQASLVLANILSGSLCSLAPVIKTLCTPNATLVLSGLLHTEVTCVAAAYAPEFKCLDTRFKEEWALIVLKHRQ